MKYISLKYFATLCYRKRHYIHSIMMKCNVQHFHSRHVSKQVLARHCSERIARQIAVVLPENRK